MGQGGNFVRPTRPAFQQYERLYEDLAALDEVLRRVTLRIGQAEVSEDQRAAALINVASLMRIAARLDANLASWSLGERKPSILFPPKRMKPQ
ncbi:hypothetical protein U0C82_16695 [Fulvimarina sp. 2208YS6-2-32]|uniref:Uncharacterized protein n=1 Tax=Fulvimarina uroteuthidis TaxID=3098149 RepID=A0ABU5I934_9HYPH|nr:hypothetical protein [Fulvimarina sp. 2208YS6-2-32]MDY8110781.1 hypothetical protein [Fulvimarina sp. 2208YS6-2-32]